MTEGITRQYSFQEFASLEIGQRVYLLGEDPDDQPVQVVTGKNAHISPTAALFWVTYSSPPPHGFIVPLSITVAASKLTNSFETAKNFYEMRKSFTKGREE